MTTRPETRFALNRARILFFLLPFSSFLSVSSPVHAQDVPVFRASTDVVVVPVTVTDGSGRFVRGLTADQFEILDDGSPRAITQFSAERVPVSLGILLDISGSMSPMSDAGGQDSRWADTRRALELLVTRLDQRDEVFFAVFNEKVALAAPWTQDHVRILRAFDALQAGGNTSLFNAVKLIAPAFRLAKHQRKVLLLVSDGDDNSIHVSLSTPGRGSTSTTYMGVTIHDDKGATAAERQWMMKRMAVAADSKAALNESGALLYAIGMGTRKGAKVDQTTLNGLARDSGGYVEPLQNPSEIAVAVARICDDLQAQYVLAFEPGRSDGQFHKIAVRVKGKRVNVRAKAGYVAGASTP